MGRSAGTSDRSETSGRHHLGGLDRHRVGARLPGRLRPGSAGATQTLDAAVNETLGSDPGIALERVVKEGHAAPVLLAAARDADLLVVGSHGHGAFAGMLIGSVSEHLMRHAPCAVVVVHCDKHSRH